VSELKLYRASVEFDVVVLAKDYADACYIAERAVKRDHHDDADNVTAHLVFSNGLPAGWDADCLPYSNGADERTIGEILNTKAEPA